MNNDLKLALLGLEYSYNLCMNDKSIPAAARLKAMASINSERAAIIARMSSKEVSNGS